MAQSSSSSARVTEAESPYDVQKEEVPEGTWEDANVAFQQFLGSKPKVFGHFGGCW